MSRIEVSRIEHGVVLRSRHHLSRAELDAAVADVAADGGGAVRWFVCEPTHEERAAAAAHGLRPDAPLLHLRCTLPLAASHRLRPDFVTRAFRPGVDDAEWLALNARAFADHPEQGAWTERVLAARMAEPWFDPTGFLVHERDGRMAGFCWTKVHAAVAADGGAHTPLDPHGEAEGEIYAIGVDPALHGRGIGRALAVAGFAHLAARGLRHGMLFVRGDNAAARSLYASLGLTEERRDEVFVGSVAARPSGGMRPRPGAGPA